MSHILLTGGSGKLGKQIRKVMPESCAPTHQQLDITDSESVDCFIKKLNVDTIFHCAAMTNVKLCEENHKQAYHTNVIGTGNLCRSLSKHHQDAYFIYVSTACVFRGDDLDKYYSEDDIPYPKNFYGLTKMLGEIVVQESSLRTLIVRTNFIEQGNWPYPKAFMDRYATYLYSYQVAEAIVKLHREKQMGVIHVCGDTRKSMFEFAQLSDPNVQPLTLDEYYSSPFNPPLTRNMCLSSVKMKPIKLSINK